MALILFLYFTVFCSAIDVDNWKGFQWYNKPTEFHTSEDDKVLTVVSHPLCDYWRKTWYPHYSADTGNFFYQEFPTKEVKNLTMEVAFDGKYTDLYDQSGLMIRLDEKYWLKTGIEFDDGCTCASSVVTNDYSDWGVVKLCQNDSNFSGYFYIKIYIDDINSFEVSFSLDGGKTYNLLRIGRLPFDQYDSVKLGIMTASPKNTIGFTTVFKDFLISNEASCPGPVSPKGVPS